MLGMLHFASPERQDSLAAVIAVMAAPSGSDLNPARLDGRYRVPSVPQNGVVQRRSKAPRWRRRADVEVLPLSAIVTREGRVSGLEVLERRKASGVEHRRRPLAGRLEPAEFAGSPVAVNLVWLVAQTTVKPKSRS